MSGPTGYQPCGCRDCMELAIGEPGVLCCECDEAGCEHDQECQVEFAFRCCQDCGQQPGEECLDECPGHYRETA